MSTIDEIKARIDIVELIGETVKLRRSGRSYTGFCPFHENKRTPAFAVFPDSGTWRCFGQCNEGGDIFKFVMKKEGWDFPQALQYLARRAGVPLEAPTPQKRAEDEELERLRTLLEEAVIFYRHHLLNTAAGKPALEYLLKRGLKLETIEQFGLGYAPEAWEAAVNHFTARGYSTADLLNAGLASPRQPETSQREGTGGIYDRFRNRILFPIRDPQGHMAGFGARVLDPNDQPKFLNSPQSRLFDKGRLLYGLDLARKAIRAQDQAVIVEGYLDVIILHQCGFVNTVSPMGTALTEDQLRLLKRLTRRIVLALDADAAGEKATLRGLEVARQAMDHSTELVFDARGLLRQEGRLQADLRVTTIPAGMDPDEVALRNPEEWRAILTAARPIVVHVMQTLASGRDLEDPKVKSDIAARVLPLIEDVPNPVEREAYRQRLARLLRIDERALIGIGKPPPQPSRRPTRSVSAQTTAAPVLIQTQQNLARLLEIHILRLLLRQPDALYLLDRALQKAGLSRFMPEDLLESEHQTLGRLIVAALEQDEAEPPAYILASVPPALEGLLQQLWAPLPQGEPSRERLVEDLIRSVFRLRLTRIKEELAELTQLQKDLQESGGQPLESYRELVQQYTETLKRLNTALGHPIAAD
jgi:DNA primase